MKYPGEKIYHYAAKINGNGDVSALCYAKPRAINLSNASWTIRKEAVTCRKCRAALSALAIKDKEPK